MKKLYPLVFCLVVVGLVLGSFGCAKPAPPAPTPAPTPAPAPAPAPKPEKPFYEGKVIRIIAPTNPGGGYDFYARLVARGMEIYLPGSTAIVKNIPGAGHILGTNEMYAAKPDGLTFGDFNKGLVANQIVGSQGIKFDLSKMSWLGSGASEAQVLFLSTHGPFKTIEDVKRGDKELILPTSGIGAINHVFAELMRYMGVMPNLKVLTGYASGEGAQAIMRGDAHAWIGSYSTQKALIATGDAFPALAIGEDELLSEEWPNLPSLKDVVSDSQKYVALIDFMVVQTIVGRPFAGPPGIPKDRLQILRKAFEKTLHDPKILAIAKKAEKPITYIDGEKAAAMVKSALDQPPELVAILKKATGVE